MFFKSVWIRRNVIVLEKFKKAGVHLGKNYSGRYNERWYSEDLGITDDILKPSSGRIYGKEPRYNGAPL